MTTQITEGIQISVECVYQPEYSNPEREHFMFAYQISIENKSDYTIQLISRYWNIFDSNGDHNEVYGDGVVGEQPVIEPGKIHQYTSGCNLKTEIGFMEGHYKMIRLLDSSEFEVEIPRFNLLAEYILN